MQPSDITIRNNEKSDTIVVNILIKSGEATLQRWIHMAKSLRSKRKQKIKRLRKKLFYEKDKAKEALEKADSMEGRCICVL